MIDVKRLIELAHEMPPFPATTVRLAQLVSSPDCNLADVAELIAYDQTLTFKLLCAANSAANAGATRISTARDAVSRLGTAQVMALAVAISARPHLQNKISAYGLAEGALWRHSVAAAVSAEASPRYCTSPVPPEVFTAALVHDIGKLVMGRFLNPDLLHQIAESRDTDNLTQLQAEVRHIGMHHGELGGHIARHWQLPPRVVLGITYHHDPTAAGDIVCDFTYLANRIAHRLEAGFDGREPDLTFLPEVAKRLGTGPDQLNELTPAAATRFAQVSRRYNSV